MVDESGAIADGEYIIEADSLKRVAYFDEAMRIRLKAGGPFVGREGDRGGAGCPNDEVCIVFGFVAILPSDECAGIDPCYADVEVGSDFARIGFAFERAACGGGGVRE